MLPIFRLQAAINSHGWHVAVGATERAIACRRKRVGEARLGNVAGGLAEDAFRLGLKDLKRHGHFYLCIYNRLPNGRGSEPRTESALLVRCCWIFQGV